MRKWERVSMPSQNGQILAHKCIYWSFMCRHKKILFIIQCKPPHCFSAKCMCQTSLYYTTEGD